MRLASRGRAENEASGVALGGRGGVGAGRDQQAEADEQDGEAGVCTAHVKTTSAETTTATETTRMQSTASWRQPELCGWFTGAAYPSGSP